jgi:hypothetical protein
LDRRESVVGAGHRGERLAQRKLIHLRENQDHPVFIQRADVRRIHDRRIKRAGPISPNAAGRKLAEGRVIRVQRQAELLDIVRALDPPRCFPCRLHGRQQQRNQDANDRNHHQQLDERETAPNPPGHRRPRNGRTHRVGSKRKRNGNCSMMITLRRRGRNKNYDPIPADSMRGRFLLTGHHALTAPAESDKLAAGRRR